MNIDVRTIYDTSDYSWCDYQPMLNAFGDILIQVDDNDYQGDSRLLYENDGKFGVLIFGWGSCSGCDALQACYSIEEVQKLCDELQNDIKWFDTAKEAHSWFIEHDWEGDYSWAYQETRYFINHCLDYLEKRMEEENAETV